MSASETQTAAGGEAGAGVNTATAAAASNRDNNPFPVPSIQIPPPPPPAQPHHHHPQPLTIHNLSFPYPTNAPNLYKPPLFSSASAGVSANDFSMNSGNTPKRKRGRPRKYGPDGSIVTSLVRPPPHPTPSPPVTITSPPAGNFPPSVQLQQPSSVADPPPSGTPSLPSSSTKKARARPPGSAENQEVELLGSAAIGMTAHVIFVKPGEDVSAKIISFSQHSDKAICIFSANGVVSNVTLHQVATSGGTATYEGLFNILSLSGSFLPSELGNPRGRTGGLSVILAGPDGRVLGGCVAGVLIAASPVQIIVGSFMADGR